jgi:sugar O-acyltransferase (sialic acid O-acetyltransferase NeuD family)
MRISNLPVILVGSGGHALVLLDVLRASGYQVLGVVDPKLATQGTAEWRGLPVLGDDASVSRYAPDTILLANGIGNLPGQTKRAEVYERFCQQGYQFVTVVHPTAMIASGVTLHQGVQIMAGAILQPDVVVGENTLINAGCIIDHECAIGAHCHLSLGVTLSCRVTMGIGCHAGAAASVVQGCQIGDYAVLGAGTALRVNLPAASRLLDVRQQEISKE